MNNPQRCFSCNKILGNLWEKYEERIKKKKQFEDICKELGVTRYCCKRMLLSQKNFYNIFSQYKKYNMEYITINNTSLNSLFHKTI